MPGGATARPPVRQVASCVVEAVVGRYLPSVSTLFFSSSFICLILGS
jgi:hypothetical protein